MPGYPAEGKREQVETEALEDEKPYEDPLRRDQEEENQGDPADI